MKVKMKAIGLTIVSLAVILTVIILFVTSDRQTDYDNTENGDHIAAYVISISADSITVDITEYITDTDTERIAELGLTEDDMLDGYYFYNEDENVSVWKCSEETVYTFVDWNGDFTNGEYPAEYTTTDREEFQKYLESYENGEPGMPFFFTIENGCVKQITEKPFA